MGELKHWMPRHSYPYWMPFIVFIGFFLLQDLGQVLISGLNNIQIIDSKTVEYIKKNQIYLIYPLKTVVVGALLILFFRNYPALKPVHFLSSLGIGILGFVIWVGLDPLLVRRSGEPEGYNPQFLSQGLNGLLLTFRVAGAVLVVPLMEEVFWRGFLMRYLIREEFEEVRLGTYSHVSFWVTTAFFVSIHGNQWTLAIPVGLLFGWWFLRTKTLGDVVLAHAVTNLLLGLYVVYTGKWYFW
ncbi:MAG: CAAX prenyl protease-related protein [Verrucomicrobiae bacterium]|nr:CAAX prenyl protease-related protein [Verrucomicrobiae bacterium]